MGVELIVGQTNQEIVEVHPTAPSPPGPVGPKGDKGDPGDPTTMWRTGTGPPTISAPVGTRYTDTAATAGAIEWIKATGTGNTGWQIAYGDTGWRNLVSWDSLGNITNGALASSDYAPQANLAGGIWVKRSGSRVHIEISRLSVVVQGTNQVLYNLPAGFRPKFVHRFGHEVWGTGGVKQAPFQALPGGNISRGGNSGFAAGDYWIQASTTFDTPDSWPTTLPGTAA